jgi:hypothetical protein
VLGEIQNKEGEWKNMENGKDAKNVENRNSPESHGKIKTPQKNQKTPNKSTTRFCPHLASLLPSPSRTCVFSMSESEFISGGCNCGGVKYRAKLPAIYSGFCHCKFCRASSGAPFAAIVAFPLPSIEWYVASSIVTCATRVMRTLCVL